MLDPDGLCRRPLDGGVQPEVFCYEPECVGKGDTCCRVIAQAADAADPVVQALQADYRVENVEAELGRMLEALEQQEKALVQQQAKVSGLESQLSSLREALMTPTEPPNWWAPVQHFARCCH